jgi:hypothetical protein
MSVCARQQLGDFQDLGYGPAASTPLFPVIAAMTVISDYIIAGRLRSSTRDDQRRAMRRAVPRAAVRSEHPEFGPGRRLGRGPCRGPRGDRGPWLDRVGCRGRRAVLMVVLAVSMFLQVAVRSGMVELVRWLGLCNALLTLALSYSPCPSRSGF